MMEKNTREGGLMIKRMVLEDTAGSMEIHLKDCFMMIWWKKEN